MIDFLTVQFRLGRITLEQIESKFGSSVRKQVETNLLR